MVIDWSKFENKSLFVRFEDNVTKRLVVTNWSQGVSKFGTDPARPSLSFDVVSEDGNICSPPKKLDVSNHTFVMGLRPIIEGAEKNGKGAVKIAAKRSGSGKGTTYMVLEETS